MWYVCPMLITLIFFMLTHCGKITVIGHCTIHGQILHTVNILWHLREVLAFQVSEIIQEDLTLQMTFYSFPVELVTVLTNCSGRI